MGRGRGGGGIKVGQHGTGELAFGSGCSSRTADSEHCHMSDSSVARSKCAEQRHSARKLRALAQYTCTETMGKWSMHCTSDECVSLRERERERRVVSVCV